MHKVHEIFLVIFIYLYNVDDTSHIMSIILANHDGLVWIQDFTIDGFMLQI